MIRCDAFRCVRGVVHRPGGFGDACKFCGGAGELSMAQICFKIDENEQTVAKLLRPNRKMRAKTAYRIFEKLMAIIEPPGTRE